MKNRLFLSFAVVAVLLAESAVAVETIRPEDEALLSGVFNNGVVIKKAQQDVVVPVVDPVKKVKVVKENVEETKADAVEVVEAPVSAVPSKRTLVYPLKAERDAVRAQSNEWLDLSDINARKAEREAKEVFEDPRLGMYKDMMASCLDERKDKLGLEKTMLYSANVYDGMLYLTKTFEEVNGCYEDIGYSIIDEYYGGDAEVADKFRQKAETFYVKSSGLNFDAKHCGEKCSIKSLVDAQMAKFADFRKYLAELLVNRPQG